MRLQIPSGILSEICIWRETGGHARAGLTDGKELFNKHYAGEGSAGLAWEATEESFAQPLALALSSALSSWSLT